MGGFGSGGMRISSGRKPKAAPRRFLDGGADRRGSKTRRTEGPLPKVAIPADLTRDQRAVWADWRPMRTPRAP